MSHPIRSRWTLPDLLAASGNPNQLVKPLKRFLGGSENPARRAGVEDLRRAALGEMGEAAFKGSSRRSPAALAWAWLELDSRERALARVMPPFLLARWLAGSFDNPRLGLTAGTLGPDTEAMRMAALFEPQMAGLRRALRAKTLASLAALPSQWGEGMALAKSMLTPAFEQESPEIAKAIKAGSWRAGEVQRGVGLFIAGACAFGFLPLAPLTALSSTALEVGALIGAHAGAAGSVIWGARAAISSRNHPNEITGPLFADIWGPSGKALLLSTYPDLGRSFDVWGTFGDISSSSDFGLAYQGLEEAGFNALELRKKIPKERAWDEQELGEPSVANALEALIESQELQNAIAPQPHPPQTPAEARSRPRI